MWMPARQHWQRAFYIPAERSARQEEWITEMLFWTMGTWRRKRGITIFSKQARIRWKDVDITLLDTPGTCGFFR